MTERVYQGTSVDALERFNRHWSVRCWWVLQHVGRWLYWRGFERLARWYGSATLPLAEWLEHRQAVFLLRGWL
jgi:hypothetical protein